MQKIISNIDTLSKAIGDNRLKSQVKKLKSISDQWHDRNNEMCRYPVNKEEEVIVLQQQVDIYDRHFNILKTVFFFTIDLLEEYKTQTFTQNLSRADIFDLYRKLPKYDTWKEKLTIDLKTHLCNEFKISKSELSKVIKLTEKNYELASIISYPLKLKGCSNDDLTRFIQIIEEYSNEIEGYSNDKPTRQFCSVTVDQFTTAMQFFRDTQPFEDKVKQKLLEFSNDALYGIYVLMIFGRDCSNNKEFSENYTVQYDLSYTKHHDKKGMIDYLLSKQPKGLLKYINNGLLTLGWSLSYSFCNLTHYYT